jgi:cytochrome c peroxidase
MRFAKFVVVSALPWAIAFAGVAYMPPSSGETTTVAAAGNDNRGNNNNRGNDNRHNNGNSLDRELRRELEAAGFTGEIEKEYRKRLKQSLGRPIDQKLAELGRLLWFDNLHSNGRDNTCGGCHSPTNGMGDTQPIAIGVQSNLLVGPHRTGPRNQRRTPTVINTALFPRLMWNNRFEALSGDPFDASKGFSFPLPEGDTRFSRRQNQRHDVQHLLQAQAHIPPTELIEVGGFLGACAQPDLQAWCDAGFDFGPGLPVPDPDSSGFRNEPIRQVALAALNANAKYRKLFGDVFREVKHGAPIDFFMFGKAIAEFEFTLVFADAPLDQFARGDEDAMSDSEKRGALVFFDKANCVSCHRVDGNSNEMFSDFKEHVAGVPQVFPTFGNPTGNFPFSGPGGDEDFGREERSGAVRDRYKFRTAPLRNAAVQAAFFHNGAFKTLEGAIRFHLDAIGRAPFYNPATAGVPVDLQQTGPMIDPNLIARRLQTPVILSNREFDDLVQFVKTGLLDDRARKSNLCGLIPQKVPSGMPVLTFEGCPTP